MDITIDIDEILMQCSRHEKRKLLDELLDDPDLADTKAAKAKQQEERQREHSEVTAYIDRLSAYEKKRLLCDVLDVQTYTDEQALREALELIIKA